jgi:hypothetical protein
LENSVRGKRHILIEIYSATRLRRKEGRNLSTAVDGRAITQYISRINIDQNGAD